MGPVCLMGQHCVAFKKEHSAIHFLRGLAAPVIWKVRVLCYEFTDVTLAWEDGQWVEAHKIILAGCSQKKHHNPHVWAEWFLFWCPENENGKQVPLLAAQNWYFGWDNWRGVPGRSSLNFLGILWYIILRARKLLSNGQTWFQRATCPANSENIWSMRAVITSRHIWYIYLFHIM